VDASGFPAAFAFFIRPTSVLFTAAIGMFILLHRRKQAPVWIATALAAAVPFWIYNHPTYGGLIGAGSFLPFSIASIKPLAQAMAGQCISPSRGLFVFTPFLLFAIWGAAVAVRRRWETPLPFYLAGVVLAHWFVISAFRDWTAGYCFGPRYFSDMVPILLFFLIPLFENGGLLRRSRAAAATFAVLAVISIWIHYRGAAVWSVYGWNSPDMVTNVWNWSDPQFLRGL
jgi:hypothetical protein